MLSISLIARLHISNEERQVILNICACIDAKLNDLDYEVTSIINAQNNIRDLRYTDETLNDKCRRYFDADIKCKKREARKIVVQLRKLCVDLRKTIRRKQIPECKAVYAATQLLDEKETYINSKSFQYATYRNAVNKFRKEYQRLEKYLKEGRR